MADMAAPELVRGGVEIALAPPMARLSLRARDPKVLEDLLGTKLPRRIGETLDGIGCLGPDEWLLRSTGKAPTIDGAGLPVSIVDVSERSICFVLDGPDARAVLNAGCPLDLEKFAVGRMTRTVYDGVEIVLMRESETRWSAEVWRSFAEWFRLSLETAAAHP